MGVGRNGLIHASARGEQPAKSLAVAAWLHLDLCKSGRVKADFFGNRNFPAFRRPFANLKTSERKARSNPAPRQCLSSKGFCCVGDHDSWWDCKQRVSSASKTPHLLFFFPAEKVFIEPWLCSGHPRSSRQEKMNFLHFLFSRVLRSWDLHGVWGWGSWHPRAVPCDLVGCKAFDVSMHRRDAHLVHMEICYL